MRAVVQPRVQRHERLAAHALQPPHDLGEQAERRAEQVAAQALGLGAGGCDQQLVGNAARDRAAGDEPVALEHGNDLRQPALGDHGRGRRRQPGELRMRVRQRGACVAALVQEREAVAADVARASLPGLGDELERGVRQLADRMDMRRPVDHDLLALERRVEIRHDADVPAGRPVAEPQALRRCLVLVPGAERARLRRVAGSGRRSGPGRARRRHCDPASGHRVVPQVCHGAIQQVSAPM